MVDVYPSEIERLLPVNFLLLLFLQDIGYGSVRSRSSEVSDSTRCLENIDWSSSQKDRDISEIKLEVPEKVSVV